MFIKESPPFFFGIVALLVGGGVAYLIVAFPEGLNSEWPLGMALLVPGVFALAGLHMIGTGLGFERSAIWMLKVLPFVLLAVLNWGVFFTSEGICTATISFLGAELVTWQPSEAACVHTARWIVLCFDALFLVPLLAFAWSKLRRA